VKNIFKDEQECGGIENLRELGKKKRAGWKELSRKNWGTKSGSRIFN